MIAADLRLNALQRLLPSPGKRDPRTLPRQRLGDGGTDAARRAGHQRRHSRKIEHAQISFTSVSMSSFEMTLVVFTSGAMRFTMGARPLPTHSTTWMTPASAMAPTLSNRKVVVWGKSVSVRVALGGRRRHQTKNKNR